MTVTLDDVGGGMPLIVGDHTLFSLNNNATALTLVLDILTFSF